MCIKIVLILMSKFLLTIIAADEMYIETTKPSAFDMECNSVIVFDVSENYINEYYNATLKNFIANLFQICVKRNYEMNIWFTFYGSMFGKPYKSQHCINMDGCMSVFKSIDILKNKQSYKYDNGTIDENSLTINRFINGTNPFFSLAENFECNMNSVILFTNRIMDFKKHNTFAKTFINSCSNFSVFLMGREDLTFFQLQKYYGYIENSILFYIPNYNCLDNFVFCLSPFNTENYNQCLKNQNIDCVYIKKRIYYVLALSLNISEENLKIISNNLINTTNDWMNDNNGSALWVKIVVSSREESPVLTTLEELSEYISNITINQTEIYGETYDENDEEMSARMELIMNRYSFQDTLQIILLTDFYSKNIEILYLSEFSPFGPNYNPNYNHNYTWYFAVFNSDAYESYINFTKKSLLVDLTEIISYTCVSSPNSGCERRRRTLQTTTIIEMTTTSEISTTLFSSFSTSAPKSSSSSSLLPTSISTTPLAEKHKKKNLFVIFITVPLAILLLLIGIFIYFYRKRRLMRAKRMPSSIASKMKLLNLFPHFPTKIVPSENWELTWDKIILMDEKLGSGAFAEVLKGKLKEKPKNYDEIMRRRNLNITILENIYLFDVAIKRIPKYASDLTKEEFLKEISLTKLLNGHENIITMFGCITNQQPMCLVLEYYPNCDLLKYVKTQTVEVKTLNIFSWQIARGMDFLVSKGIIHRDLAARNILIDDDDSARISDFGLCLQLEDKAQKTITSESIRLPVKWLAIESLKNREFNFKTDIWSFGVVLYEMYSQGKIPFKEIEAEMLLEHLLDGNRLDQPEICPNEIYEIMENCWNEDPIQRRTFEELVDTLTSFLEDSNKNYGYVKLIERSV